MTKAFDVTVPAHSINTFVLDGEYKNTPTLWSMFRVKTQRMQDYKCRWATFLSAEGISKTAEQ